MPSFGGAPAFLGGCGTIPEIARSRKIFMLIQIGTAHGGDDGAYEQRSFGFLGADAILTEQIREATNPRAFRKATVAAFSRNERRKFVG